MRDCTTRSRWGLIALSTALLSLALPVTTLSASASEPRVVVAGVTPIPNKDVVVNKVITASFDVALTVRHQAKLSAYIASLSNTASPNYHHYLTPAQYAGRYGASASSVNAVRSYLQSSGLQVGALSKGHNILHVSGTTTRIARAMDAPIQTVRQSDGALVARLKSSATFPSSLAKDVVSVAGLSSVQPETTNLEHTNVVATPTSCAAASGSGGGYTVQQQATLYGLTAPWAAGDTGVGQTVAIYELATYDPSDVNTFFSCYGLAPSYTSINVDGGPTTSDNATPPGGSAPTDEATLDLEEVAALAPGATFEVYQGTNSGSGPTDLYSRIASDNTASIVSTSWGNCEAASGGSAQAEQVIFQEMATQGQTVLSAAGDSGSADCQGGGTTSAPALAVDDPASQPYVTGVGGLTVTSINPLVETVWNENCTQSSCGASGGGVSSLWSQPAWQKSPSITTTAATGGMRMVPDLTVMGDPGTGFIQYFTGSTGTCQSNCSQGWSNIGGTSIGAPLVSSLVAVAAQACDVPGGRLGFINPTLYAMPASDFNDVTTGTNDLYGLGEYSAGPGYDMASGLGSPNGAAFLAGLCPIKFSAANSTFASLSNSPQASTVGPTLSAVLRDVNGNPVANAVVAVTATASSGLLRIDGVVSSQNGDGNATLPVTSDASGALSFNVSSSVAQDVQVSITYEGQSIYTTTLSFKAAPLTATKPGPPTITKLTPLVGGFTLALKAPTNTGGDKISHYQYSLTRGKTWITVARGALATSVTKLAKHKSYTVIARAINAIGASIASAAKKVVTRS
ncbi:MAG TPA: S53 family peptidase [Acidimicrobiales bacterium]|nr:S53 family peptidase [Acidimicrobiales bacterium]